MSISHVSNFNYNGQIGSRRVEIKDDTGNEIRFGGGVERQDFSELVKDFAKDVNDLQFQAGHAIDMLVTGQAADIHQVMVAVEEAGIARDLLLEIRNKVLEGYQELMRMQV